MVVSKTEFNNSMTQINVSYAKLYERIENLEKQVAELVASKVQAKPQPVSPKASK